MKTKELKELLDDYDDDHDVMVVVSCEELIEDGDILNLTGVRFNGPSDTNFIEAEPII